MVGAASIQKRLFGISLQEVTFVKRGFHATSPQIEQHLQQVGSAFLHGYHLALESRSIDRLGDDLNAVDSEFRGFAFEGAAMGLTLLDTLIPWKKDRLEAFLAGPGEPHIYMAYVGAGWVWARLRKRVRSLPTQFDPLLGWLALDGYGFHEGYFNWPRSIRSQEVPRRILGYGRRVYDQGLGRSLWFVEGADVLRISGVIASFPESRRDDLWSGIGLASTYAGGVDRSALEALCTAAANYAPHLAQGAAFAAKARLRAGNPTAHTQMACELFCGMDAEQAAAVTDDALEGLQAERDEPLYEAWRRRIRHLLMESKDV